MSVAGCWFHYAQAVYKRLTKISLRAAYMGNQYVQKIVRCLLSLPVLPPGEIVQAVSNIRPEIADDGQHLSFKLSVCVDEVSSTIVVDERQSAASQHSQD